MIGYIIGGIGLLIAIFFGIRDQMARRSKQPIWSYRIIKVIGLGSDAPPQLKLNYNDQLIDDLYRTNIVFYNKGRLCIRSEDVPVFGKIQFHFKGATILDQPELTPSRKEIPLSIKLIQSDGDPKIQVNFDYLEHNDGVAFEVLHTKVDEVTCAGTVLDAKDKGIVYNKKFVPYRKIPLHKYNNFSMWCVFFVLTVVFLVWGLLDPETNLTVLAGILGVSLVLLTISIL